MKLKEIEKRVRACIDGLDSNQSGFIDKEKDEDNLTLIIKDKVKDALVYILLNAPASYLQGFGREVINDSKAEKIVKDDLSVSVALPGNVLRLLSARLDSWYLTPDIVDEQSEVAMMQANEWTRGSWDRPVVVFGHRGTDDYLFFYSAKNTNDKVTITYIKAPELDNVTVDTDIDLPKAIETAFIYQVAGLTLMAQQDQLADKCLSMANTYLGITENPNPIQQQ